MSRRSPVSKPNRFVLHVLLATTVGLVLAAGTAPAEEPPSAVPAAPAAPQATKPQNEARALLEEANRLDDTSRAWKDRTQRLKLRIVDGRANERLRELTMKTVKREGGEDKTITVFHMPPEVRGTSFLQFAHRDRDAEQWLFLPALNRVRQISAQSKSESFMGTDFSYRDLELLSDVLEWTEEEAPSHLAGTEKIGDVEVALIDLTPKKKDVGYQRIRIALAKSDLVIRRMEFYGSGEAPKKLLKLDDIRDVGGIPTAYTLEMVQPQAGSQTYVAVVDVKYNQGLDDDQFTSRALERGALDAE